MKYSLSIGSIFKNEGGILKEWIEFYLKKGVEHFYLVDNNSTDNYQSIIRQYRDNVTLFQDSRHPCQMLAYNELILPIAKLETEWLLIVDLDEFVYNPEGKPFLEVLRRYRHVPSVGAPWIFFGSSRLETQPESVVKGFTWRMYYGGGKPVNVKNFYQTKYVSRLYPHHADFVDSYLFGISSKSHTRLIDGMDIVSESDLKNKRFAFLTNHYAIQSKQFFFEIKAKRGDVYSQSNDLIRDASYFENYDYNEIMDLEISKENNETKPISKVIIGFPSPDRDRLQKNLDDDTYYDDMLIYDVALAEKLNKFGKVEVWVIIDSVYRILYSYWKRIGASGDFNEIYKKELKAVENGEISMKSTKLLQFGDIEHYIRKAQQSSTTLQFGNLASKFPFEIETGIYRRIL